MYAFLSIDGEPAEFCEETPERVALEFDTDAPTHYCRACNQELVETSDGYESNGTECPKYEPADAGDLVVGPHDPEPVPLSWCNSVSLHTDASEDAVTVSVSVGDPRGAFTFTIRRVPDDAYGPLAGRLIMHTPYPGELCPHVDLSPLHPGTYLLGEAASSQSTGQHPDMAA